MMQTTETVENIQDAVDDVNQLQQYFNNHVGDLITFGIKLVLAILIFIIGRYLIKWLRKLVKKSLEFRNADAGIITFIDSLLRILLYFLLIYLLAIWFGFDTTSVAAILASVSVAVGLALQGSLSNLAGGILLLILKPFKVGDYIIEDTNGKEGTVKEIQIFYTVLTSVDNKKIVIPNGVLTSNSLTNVTAKNDRMLDLRIGISYESDLKKAKSILHDILEKDEAVSNEEERLIFVDDLGEHAVILGVRAWVKKEEFLTAKWRLLESIKLTFDENNITIPYQQVVVHSAEKENQ